MSPATRIETVDTDQGPARLLIDSPGRRGSPGGPGRTGSSGRPGRTSRLHAVLALGHGAGGGPDAVDLAALAERLPAAGIEVVRVEQPWRLAGKRIAPRPAVLDEAWLQALDGFRRLSGPGIRSRAAAPLIVGGRSAGARVACRTARELAAIGCLALAFPLHPPGKADDPDKDRSPELLGSGLPTLVLQGERDPFGGPDAVIERARPAGTGSAGAGAAGAGAAGAGVAGAGAIRVIPVPQAGHELTVPKTATITQGDVGQMITDHATEWIEELIDGK